MTVHAKNVTRTIGNENLVGNIERHWQMNASLVTYVVDWELGQGTNNDRSARMITSGFQKR